MTGAIFDFYAILNCNICRHMPI